LSQENSAKKTAVDTLLVLGGGGCKDRRPQRAVDAYNDQPSIRTIICCGFYTGILTEPPEVSEAKIMADYCVRQGISAKRILLEQESLDTLANAILAEPHLAEANAYRVGVVTDAFHQPRAQWLLRRVHGNTYEFSGCSTKNVGSPVAWIQEPVIIGAIRHDLAGIAPGDMGAFNDYLKNRHPFHAPDGLQQDGWYNTLIRAHMKYSPFVATSEHHDMTKRDWQQ
jgi:uncharacterized SAM-binding protein YcdF (DUF218 family)